VGGQGRDEEKHSEKRQKKKRKQLLESMAAAVRQSQAGQPEARPRQRAQRHAHWDRKRSPWKLARGTRGSRGMA